MGKNGENPSNLLYFHGFFRFFSFFPTKPPWISHGLVPLQLHAAQRHDPFLQPRRGRGVAGLGVAGLGVAGLGVGGVRFPGQGVFGLTMVN